MENGESEVKFFKPKIAKLISEDEERATVFESSCETSVW